MRRLIVAVSALGWMTGIAWAADMDLPAYDWSGFYLGVHGGGAWVDGDIPAQTPATGGAFQTWNGEDDLGLLFGGQAGFNHQFGNLVLGVEGQFSFATNEGSASYPGRPDMDYDMNWLAAVGPRIGFAADNMLLYAKGGVAFADFDYSHLSGGGPRSASTTDTGFMLGAGIEYGFTENVSAKLEYGYFAFGDDTVNVSTAPLINVAHDRDIHAVTLGVNYRF